MVDKPGKGILAISFGKSKEGSGDGLSDDAPDSEPEGGMGKSAAMRAFLAGVEAKDTAAMSEAMSTFVSQCGSDEEG